jgi:hypothetical protein
MVAPDANDPKRSFIRYEFPFGVAVRQVFGRIISIGKIGGRPRRKSTRLIVELNRAINMKIDGRCHCGYIAYEAEIDPENVLVCHCTDCQTL